MGATTIEWTATQNADGSWSPGYTFNPWLGCTKVSAACDHCYAEGWAKRTGQSQLWAGERRRTMAGYWKQPQKWNRQAETSGIRKRVFCASLADVFDNQVPDAWRIELWSIIRATPNLDWQLLTKRPQNMRKMLPPDTLPNVWLGTTVENQEEADRRIPHLLATPAAVRFLSCEPLLGPISLRPWFTAPGDDRLWLPRDIHWIIAGGESGPGKRPMDLAWARSIRDQCKAASVSFFMKQIDKKAIIPPDLMIREMPNASQTRD